MISYFQVRTPTATEIENCQHVNLTSEDEWNPYSPHFEELESKAMLQDRRLSIAAINSQCIEYSDTVLKTIHDMTSQRETASVKVNAKNLYIKEQELATKWAIGLKDTSSKVKAITQKFIRSSLHPIERRFRTKQTTLRDNQLKCRISSDTFFFKHQVNITE